jgi:hypothetical protein
MPLYQDPFQHNHPTGESKLLAGLMGAVLALTTALTIPLLNSAARRPQVAGITTKGPDHHLCWNQVITRFDRHYWSPFCQQPKQCPNPATALTPDELQAFSTWQQNPYTLSPVCF